jgi:cytochrome oxidase Cu insertion factor (SCO1/SenC/PrrC family)
MRIKKSALVLMVTMLAIVSISLQDTAGEPLSPSGQSSQAKPQVYACPMHPDVTSTSPGFCPKCGMKLTAPTVGNRPGETEAGVDPVGFNLTNKIPDVVVYDQNGNELNFYSDLVKGKTVAIEFIFTTCTTICPPLTAIMRKVQTELGERVGRDIELVSVTLDPTTDVPDRLKAYAAKFHAGEGWTFVTGKKSDIDKLLMALGGYSSDKNDHSPMILIGNDPAGYWTRSYGLAPSSTTVKLILEATERTTSR